MPAKRMKMRIALGLGAYSMVLMVSVLHVGWGLMTLLLGPHPVITSLSTVTTLVPDPYTRAALFLVAGLLPWIIGHRHWIWTTLAMVPQQALVMLAAFSVVRAVVAGAYADGTVVPHGHLHVFADQGIYLCLAVFHTATFMLEAVVRRK